MHRWVNTDCQRVRFDLLCAGRLAPQRQAKQKYRAASPHLGIIRASLAHFGFLASSIFLIVSATMSWGNASTMAFTVIVPEAESIITSLSCLSFALCSGVFAVKLVYLTNSPLPPIVAPTRWSRDHSQRIAKFNFVR